MKRLYDTLTGLAAFGIGGAYPFIAVLGGAGYGVTVVKAFSCFGAFYLGFCVLLPMGFSRLNPQPEKQRDSQFLAKFVTLLAMLVVGFAFPAFFGFLGWLVRR